jgi:hypothetical protein
MVDYGHSYSPARSNKECPTAQHSKSPPLKSPFSTRLHYLGVSPTPSTHKNSELHAPPNTRPATFILKLQENQHPYVSSSQGSCSSTDYPRHKPLGLVPLEIALQNWAPWSPCGRLGPEPWLHTGFVLLSWWQCHRTALPEACVGNWATKLPLPAGSVLPSEQQPHTTVLLEACAGNQALVYTLPAGSVILSQQQLLWLLEAHTPMQIDTRASTACWAPDDSSPTALLPSGYPQPATQCQEPATTHLSGPQAPGLANLLARSFLPHVHRVPALSTVPDNKRALASTSKSEKDSFPTEGRKAKICYSAGGIRDPIPPRYLEAQHCTTHLLAGESHISCPRAGITAPLQSGNLLYWWC